MKRKKQTKTQKTKELIKQNLNKEKGITLIALVITIIVLIILAGISISLVLGQNGLFNKAKSATTETAKARFLEDAGFAYSEAYIEKVETSNANDITIGAVVAKLKSSYGYTDEQIVTVSSGVSGITLSETEITLEPGETKDVTVELENGTYYALIEDLYYPITLSNGEVTLGEGIASLQTGDEEAKEIQATVLEESGIEVTVKGNKITIKAKDELEESGEATIEVTYGESITKTIKVKIKVGPKQGDEVLGQITVQVNDAKQTLAQGWKFFYDDEDNDKVWLIYSGILEGTAHQISSETIKLSGNSVKSSKDRNDLISYLNGTDSYTNQWDYIKSGIKNALNVEKITIDESQIEVKGSPDVQLFQKAYDQMYPSEHFEVNETTVGWQYRLGVESEFNTTITISGYSSKVLFFVGYTYWLASPSIASGGSVCNVYTRSYANFNFDMFNTNKIEARPVVSIPKTAFEQLVK